MNDSDGTDSTIPVEKRIDWLSHRYAYLVAAIVLILLIVIAAVGFIVLKPHSSGAGHPIFLAGTSSEVATATTSGSYVIKGTHVFFVSSYDSSNPLELPNAIAKTFHQISTTDPLIGTDGEHVYVDDMPLPGADVASFTVLSNLYAKDKNHVYSTCVGEEDCSGPFVVTGVDAKTYTIYPGNTYYAHDIHAIYYETYPRPVTATSSFVVLNDEYAKDTNAVYCGGTILDQADPSTFQLIQGFENEYARDAQHVFIDCTAVAGLNPDTFTALDMFYSKDDRSVYYEEGDISGFIAGADPKTFTILGEQTGYSNDISHVWYEKQLVPQADLSTFVVLPQAADCGSDCQYDAYDSHHKYIGGTVVQ